MYRITQENVDAQRSILESLKRTTKSIKEIDKRRAARQKRITAEKKRQFYKKKVGDEIDKYGNSDELQKKYSFYSDMTDEEIMAYNPPEEQPKLKIGVKKIKETESAIKNQEKTIKSKKKQILNEQEYLNTTGRIMSGESNFIDNKGKWAVATELDVKKGLNPKIRRALKKSIIEQANKIKGTNITMDF